MNTIVSRTLCILTLCAALSGCYATRGSTGGGQTTFDPPRRVNPADVALPEGYRIEAVAGNLTFPTGVAFDDAGRIYVTEAGYSYGEVWTTPRLLRIEPGKGLHHVVAEGGKNGPWTGVTFHDGNFYVAEGGALEGGRIIRISKDGAIARVLDTTLIMGDHHTNGPVAGPDGWLYFAIGTRTNSGVVGTDNYEFGWLKRYSDLHDIPCEDIILSGENFTTSNPFKPNSDERVSVGAFVPFGTKTERGQIIRGRLPCNGSIMRVSPQGGRPELVAWGFRNPFGLAFSPDGRLFVTENQYDERGSRPIYGAGDLLWEVKPGLWYGWPDYHGSHAVYENERYKPPGKDPVRQLIEKPPNTPPEPAAVLAVHSSSNGFDFSRSRNFGYEGEAFIAQFGDQAPVTGKVLSPVGFKVVRVDVERGVVHDFAVNKGQTNAPASWLKTGGLERPVAARFDPSGKALYVVDFGVMLESDEGSLPRQETGVLWRITRTTQRK